MKQKLIKILKTIVADVRQAVIPAILLLFFGGSAGLLLLSQKALDLSIQIANIPTPLWATIVMVLLLILYLYLKNQKAQSLLTSIENEKSEMAERLKVLESENEYLTKKIQNLESNWSPGIL